MNTSEISKLLQSAIDGTLQLETLESEWAKIAAKDELPEVLLDDLRDGVQHTPGHLFSGKIDLKTWRGMREHAVLVCDLLLVPFLQDRIEWNNLRVKVIENLDGYSYEAVEAKVSEILGHLKAK